MGYTRRYLFQASGILRVGVLLVVEIYERVVKSQPYGRSGDVPFLSKRAYKRVRAWD